MASSRIIVAIVVVCLALGIGSKTTNALPVPDSAGIVEMVNGLAYGGIPYGSVSGMLANYEQQRQVVYNGVQQGASVLVPDTRTASIGY